MARKRQKPAQSTAFSKQLTRLRQQAGLTMTALGDKIGVSGAYISQLEAGERQPSREVVMKMAATLLSPDDIQGLDDLLVLAGLSPTRYEVQAELEDTQGRYQALLRQEPDNFRVFTALIRLLLRNPSSTEAEPYIYAGMKQFQAAYQLQVLMAYLQMHRHDFAAALTSLHMAEQMYAETPPQAEILADLASHSATAYFLWALTYTSADTAHLPAEACGHLEAALHHTERALQHTPEDIYLRDEWARLLYNRAYFSGDPAHWPPAIEALLAVVSALDSSDLGAGSVRELSAFLAHAYTKAGQFDIAHALLSVLGATQPHFWLVAYLRACYYSLRLAAEPEGPWYSLGFAALQQALGYMQPSNQSARYAAVDPDLNALRHADSAAFAALLATAPVRALMPLV